MSSPKSERQPLLSSDTQDLPVYSEVSRPNDEETPLVGATDANSQHSGAGDGPNSDRNTWIGYGVLLVVGTTALVLLIKGLIESGDVEFDLKGALKSALGGGLSGAAAMVLQVLLFMPLRTVMNYQYRYGTSTSTAFHTLNSQGFTRFYQGLTAALFQGPLARFGDTAANAGILALLQSNPYMRKLSIFYKTLFASVAAAAFRIVLTPIDTIKTTLQAQGREGWGILKTRIRKYGITTMWYGALATAAATFVGHYPWFGTYNYLDSTLPPANTTLEKLSRRAFIGFVASVVSDTISNSLRVVKTYRQVNHTRIGYVAAAKAVLTADGWQGLFGRGLKTRILANGLQGLTFSVLWRWFLDIWNEKTKFKQQ